MKLIKKKINNLDLIEHELNEQVRDTASGLFFLWYYYICR
jgi:hypothetical protein